MNQFILYLPQNIRFSPEQLLALCEHNSHLRIETDTEQNLIVMSPTGYQTGNYNAFLIAKFYNWNSVHKLGYISDSSTGFRLPDGSVKAPDVAFDVAERIHSLAEEDRRGFAPLCPDFVLELRSPTDTKKDLLAKMETYLANGCRLAWLIDPLGGEVHVYEPNKPAQVFELVEGLVLQGGEVLPGFELCLDEVLG